MNAVLAPLRAASAATTLALALLVLALIGAGGYFLVVSPARGRTAALEGRLASLQRELAHARDAVRGVARDRLEILDLETRLESIRQKLPTEREIPPLYRNMFDAASSTGLSVSLFQPREPRLQDYYTEIPISVTAEGTYHQLGKFLERVAEFPRVVTVSTLRVTGLDRPRVSLRAEMTLATYVYRPPGAAPPSRSSAPGPTSPARTMPPRAGSS